MARIFRDAAMPILLLDTEGRLLDANEEAERLYGGPRSELLGKSYTTLVPLEHRHAAERLLERCLDGARIRDVDGIWRSRSGEPIPVLVSFQALRDERGRATGIACFQTDARPEKRAELLVVENEEQVGLCRMATNFGTWSWDLSSNVALCSDAYFRLYGLEPPDAGRRSFEEWKDALHPEDAARVVESARRAVDGDAPFEEEFRVVWPDGSEHWIAGRGKVLRDSTGTPIRMLGVNIDVTRQKETERALHESAERLRAILNTAPDGILTIDRQGVIQDMNPAASRLFGYAREELVGQNVTLLMPSPHRERHAGYVDRHLETGERRVIGRTREVVAERKDGSTFPAELSVSEVDDLALFTGIIRDVSARKDAEVREAALAKALDETEERERKKFSQLLHDDLQQLLVAATIQIELLKDEPSREALVGMESLIGEALDCTRNLSVEIHPPVLEERGLGEALRWLGRRMAAHYQMEVDVEIDGGASLVSGGRGRLAFALARELLFNASKHSRAERARLEVRVLPEERLELVVRDRGVGFDVEAQRSSPSQGLGLRSIQERVQLAQGEFSITSEPGVGTEAAVRLPLSR